MLIKRSQRSCTLWNMPRYHPPRQTGCIRRNRDYVTPNIIWCHSYNNKCRIKISKQHLIYFFLNHCWRLLNLKCSVPWWCFRCVLRSWTGWEPTSHQVWKNTGYQSTAYQSDSIGERVKTVFLLKQTGLQSPVLIHTCSQRPPWNNLWRLGGTILHGCPFAFLAGCCCRFYLKCIVVSFLYSFLFYFSTGGNSHLNTSWNPQSWPVKVCALSSNFEPRYSDRSCGA